MQTNVTGTSGAKDFSKIPSANIPRSAFNRSSGLHTTLNSGPLVPVWWDEALPGDTLNLSPQLFARMATPIKPVMDGIFLDWFFFSVPLRLIWENFEKFMGERYPDPDSSIDYATPKMECPAGGWTSQSSGDYFGLPILEDLRTDDVNSFVFRAMALIYNEWFRDENLIDSVHLDLDDGPDDPADYPLYPRGKRHDYFTSALPYAQKGDPVRISMGGSAPLGGFPELSGSGDFNVIVSGSTATLAGGGPGAGYPVTSVGASGDLTYASGIEADLSQNAFGKDAPYADLSLAEGVTINALRLAFATQRLLERDARGGTRYQEIILSHFKTQSDDARLQRPELLSTGSTRINFHPVETNTQPITGTGQGPLGELAAFATAASDGKGGFTKSFTEHQVVLGFVNIRTELSYQQGINRKFSRSSRYDYYWPAFAELGEGPIYSKEIYADGTAADDDVFGYQERWAEYRYRQNEITGKFRSKDPQSLDVWHVAEEFGSRPTLNETFINIPQVGDSPINRIVAVQDEPQFLLDAWFQVNHVRPMPTFSVPGLGDRF